MKKVLNGLKWVFWVICGVATPLAMWFLLDAFAWGLGHAFSQM